MSDVTPKKSKAKKAESSVNTPKKAATSGSWKPGQSGNPGGRPGGLGALKHLAREHTESAVKALVEIVGDPAMTPAARVSAATVLLDRGYGRATQHVEVTTGGIGSMSDDELEEFLATRIAAFNAIKNSGDAED